ncbi:MAG TPA: hypothetical protein VKZ85_13395 [Woeseiaceae bacterium]|nr:hypothetical protein [Woeseiaceae bacterium]
MTIDRQKLFPAFKYTIYALLTLNVYLFFAEEWAAAAHRFANGISLADVIEGFAASIDTAVWVVLLLMFELETYVIADRLTPRRKLVMRGLRALCYVVIVYAFYGYLSKLLFLYGATPLPGVADLCHLAGANWAYAVTLDEYVVLTAQNCAGLSDGSHFFRLPGLKAAVDVAGLTDIRLLAWVDVVNSGVWLLVVGLLELDVRLQANDRLAGTLLMASNGAKYVLYSILLLAAVYWGVAGDFVDFWDAFLWLVAFFFIEMNVVERLEEDAAAEPRAVQGSAAPPLANR